MVIDKDAFESQGVLNSFKKKFKNADNMHDKSKIINVPAKPNIESELNNLKAPASNILRLNVKYKIINVNITDNYHLLRELASDNPDIAFVKVDIFYKVCGVHTGYFNAIVTVNIASAAYIESYPFVYI